jgi:hypothetical protein
MNSYYGPRCPDCKRRWTIPTTDWTTIEAWRKDVADRPTCPKCDPDSRWSESYCLWAEAFLQRLGVSEDGIGPHLGVRADGGYLRLDLT